MRTKTNTPPLAELSALSEITKSTPGHPSAKTIEVYADGSALNNPGPGGWAFVIQNPDGSRSHQAGSIEFTTNNQAEITAALEVLLFLPRGTPAIVHMDSQYVVHALNDYRARWEANGWKNANGQGVSNCELLKALFELHDGRPGVSFVWIPGHAGHTLNELADRLARTEAEKLRARIN